MKKYLSLVLAALLLLALFAGCGAEKAETAKSGKDGANVNVTVKIEKTISYRL